MGNKRSRWHNEDRGPTFLQLNHWMLRCPAWRSLSVYSRSLYVEIRARYNGRNNGDIPFSYREAEELLNCSNKPIPAAFRELQEKGFMKAITKGCFSWKVRFEGKGRASTWLLTDLPQDYPQRGLSPSKEFMSWKPDDADKNKTRHAESGPMARRERAIQSQWHAESVPMTRLKRAIRGKMRGPMARLKACTYSIPDTPTPLGAVTPQLLASIKHRSWSGKPARSSRKDGRQ